MASELVVVASWGVLRGNPALPPASCDVGPIRPLLRASVPLPANKRIVGVSTFKNAGHGRPRGWRPESAFAVTTGNKARALA